MKMLHDYESLKKPIWWIASLKLLAVTFVLYSAFLLVPTIVEGVQLERQQLSEDFKVRVIANSSSQHDQLIKQQVVENLQEYVASLDAFTPDIHSVEMIFQEIQNNYPQLTLRYEFGDNLIPPKWQFNTFYPQDHYYSLNIVIGQGRGENWFCAVFPTLCNPKAQEKIERPPSYLAQWWNKKKSKNNPQNSENYPQAAVNY